MEDAQKAIMNVRTAYSKNFFICFPLSVVVVLQDLVGEGIGVANCHSFFSLDLTCTGPGTLRRRCLLCGEDSSKVMETSWPFEYIVVTESKT
jgi:hypothetical protein